MNYEIRRATNQDIKAVCFFTDFWLAGRGKRVNAPGAVDDYFISPSQHKKYIEKYITLIAILDEKIIGWAVVEISKTMIHLLVAGDCRKQGIGSRLLDVADPLTIRSKSNQSSGNPKSWYEHKGFEVVNSVKSQGLLNIDQVNPNRKKIIDIMKRKNQRHPQ